MSVRLSALSTYPVKSLRGLGHSEIEARARGLDGDRSWMIVGADGLFLSQRSHPRMALIEVSAGEAPGSWTLHAPGAADQPLNATTDAAIEVRVWRSELLALPGEASAARWLSEFLNVECVPVRMGAPSVRRSGPWPVRFADELPLLVVSEASLADLNERISSPVTMERFRPNLVLSGSEPFEEDRWKRIRVGEVEIELVKPCARCKMITLDPRSAEFDADGEPLRTLATYRSPEGSASPVRFGQCAAVTRAGSLRVGDALEVLEHLSAG